MEDLGLWFALYSSLPELLPKLDTVPVSQHLGVELHGSIELVRDDLTWSIRSNIIAS